MFARPLQNAWPAALVGLSVLCGACATPADARFEREGKALTLSVSDLQLHLGSDAYHTFGHLDAQGRNAFSTALWRLDRIKERRQAEVSGWDDEDAVIEFARARALERLRRYRDASAAYARVAEHPGLLSAAALRRGQLNQIFASFADVSIRLEEPTLEWTQTWMRTWSALADLLDDPSYASLARLEAESWQQARVELLARDGDLEGAIGACHELAREHATSKLYERHVIRLGDLYAEVARREHVLARAEHRALDVDRYERALERAFAAYELAVESRKPVLRREAQSKIDALLAYHEGVRSDVQ